MKNRLPSDLLVAVFGPFFVIIVALVVGSLIYHAAEWGRSWTIFATIGVMVLSLLFMFLCIRRRPRRDAGSSASARTPTHLTMRCSEPRT